MLILWEKRIAPEYKIRSLAKSEETNPSLIVQFILSLMGVIIYPVNKLPIYTNPEKKIKLVIM